jgi:hypothetical protein
LSSLGYFLGAGIVEASSLPRTEPGFEASAEPGLAQKPQPPWCWIRRREQHCPPSGSSAPAEFNAYHRCLR